MAINSDFYINITDFYTFCLDSTHKNSGGLLLAVRKFIPYNFINNSFHIPSKLISIVISIPYSNFNLTIISIYRFSSESLTIYEWQSFFIFCESFSHAF